LRLLGHQYVHFFFFRDLYILTNTFYCFKFYLRREGTGRATAMKMGPNDAICVVWAASRYVTFSFPVFYITSYSFYYFKVLSVT
jgi:hypothetical protein